MYHSFFQVVFVLEKLIDLIFLKYALHMKIVVYSPFVILSINVLYVNILFIKFMQHVFTTSKIVVYH